MFLERGRIRYGQMPTCNLTAVLCVCVWGGGGGVVCMKLAFKQLQLCHQIYGNGQLLVNITSLSTTCPIRHELIETVFQLEGGPPSLAHKVDLSYDDGQ